MTLPARVLVTGAAGHLGSQVVKRLAADERVEEVIGLDVRDVEAPAGADHRVMDVRDVVLRDLVRAERIDRVIHLAAVVAPQPHHSRAFLHSVDVEGTRNVVEACVAGGIRHLTVTSSGAAYGHHPDNPVPLTEDHPLRGNPGIPYSDHKRQVEELAARAREEHPHLAQLVLRPGTILGEGMESPFTRLFERRVVVGVAGAEIPFVFCWDTDVVEVAVTGALELREGIYNIAGDGAIPLREVAAVVGRPYLPLPAWLLRAGLRLGRVAGRTGLGPEQVDLLRYRPVLSNRRLAADFPGLPTRTSREALEEWAASRR